MDSEGGDKTEKWSGLNGARPLNEMEVAAHRLTRGPALSVLYCVLNLANPRIRVKVSGAESVQLEEDFVLGIARVVVDRLSTAEYCAMADGDQEHAAATINKLEMKLDKSGISPGALPSPIWDKTNTWYFPSVRPEHVVDR